MTLELGLNIFISILLLVTVIFCFVLSKRIARFNSTKADLAHFLMEFNRSIATAEKSINELKSMGTAVDDTLKSQIKKARFLANDLSFLTEKGESVAENLEEKISISRDMYRRIASESTELNKPNQAAASSARTQNVTARNFKDESPFIKVRPINTGVEGQGGAGQNINNLSNAGKKKVLTDLLKQIADKKAEIR